MSPLGRMGDTIVAVATPHGEGGLAVVRVSGPGALDVARSLFRPARGAATLVSHRVRFGLAVSAAGEPLDEVLLLPLHAPRSYTGEDTVEFHCHGGRQPASRIVAACLDAGARAAEPGEFTKRAFLNGRLTLDQAEAVADLIHAEDALAAAGALAQLRGGLRREIAELERPLRDLLVDLEGGMEFAAGEEGPGVDRARVTLVLQRAVAQAQHLLAAAPAARRVREGVHVVLAGPPNSGKSSLFNALLGWPRALVDEEPGTTRDVITAPFSRAGLTFVLHDTAGLRAEAGRVETLGMGLTLEAVARADIILWLVDLSAGSRQAEGEGETVPDLAGAKVIAIGTKADLGAPHGGGPRAVSVFMATSARTGSGLEALKDVLVEAADAAGMREIAGAGLTLNARHQQSLIDAEVRLRYLLNAMAEEKAGDEVVASLLGAALAELGSISGRVFSEGLLGDIFARFCVGK